MKRTLSLSMCLIMLVLVCTLAVGNVYADGDARGVKLMLIVDFNSVDGCADGVSLLDKVILSARENDVKVSFFIDCENIMHDEDYSSAMMKIYAGGFDFGMYGRSGLDVSRALIYQKYTIKRVSRMLLCEKEGTVDNADEFLTYTYDVLISSGDDMSYDKLIGIGGAVAVIINEDTADDICRILSELEGGPIYLITPTETGYHIY